MTDSNRLRMAIVRETTLGQTPVSPRTRTMRLTGESLKFAPRFIQPDELRDDRMNVDPVKTGEDNSGGINFQLSFPVDNSPLSELIASGMFNAWVNTPSRDNDGVADSVITGVTATGGVITVTAGAAFVAGHLIRNTGFGVAANNGLFRITAGSATAPAVGAAGLADEPVPPGSARMKVVGFEGTAGDITALADGLGSTALNFTTLGLTVGQFVNIGGGGNYAFAAAANSGWARIVAIAAGKLTLDNLPAGWSADTGAARTIRVFCGDVIANGVAMRSMTIERGFMGQAVPTYIIQRGMVVGQMSLDMATEQIISGSFSLQGMTGEQSTASIDPVPDPATTNPNMASNVNVGRISENGAAIVGGNFVRSMKIDVNNNLRTITAAGSVGAVGIGVGEASVNVTLDTYFRSNELLSRLLSGAATNIHSVIAKNGQALVLSLPRVTCTDGSPSSGGKNQDVMLSLQAMASKDELTGAMIMLSRLEYFAA